LPNTIIRINTWGCDCCPYHQDFEPTDELMVKHFQTHNILCPSCKDGNLLLETDHSKMVVRTVTGEECIELEIENRNEETFRTQRLAEVDTQVAAMDDAGEFATNRAKDRTRDRRRETVERDIEGLKLIEESKSEAATFKPAGYFLISPQDITNYRAKRKEDISRAIIAARLCECKE